MKKLLNLTVIALAVSALLCGCGLTPKAAVYKSLATVGYSVDAAMKAYAQGCAQGIVSEPEKVRIRKLHDEQFNPAFSAAVKTAKMDYSQVTPADVQSIANDLIALINSIINKPKGATP